MSRDTWALLGFVVGALCGWLTAYLERREARRDRNRRVTMIARLFETWSVHSKDGGWTTPWRN